MAGKASTPESGNASGAGGAGPTGDTIRVGVSACLLGREVRFDGGHKHDRYITGTLAEYFEMVPVCPEVEVGMPIPRETLRLERSGSDSVRIVAPGSGTDHTRAMEKYSSRRVRELGRDRLCGYLLKKNSPSCGLERVRVYNDKGMPHRDGVGVFARALMERMPLLPVEEEGRLNDPYLRENFIERVFAYHRVTGFFRGRWSLGGLVALQSREKMLVQAHKPAAEKELGRLVAEAKGRPRPEVAGEYMAIFLEALSTPVKARRHVNVLHHILGHFRKRLDPAPRAALLRTIEDYAAGLLPIIVPITLIRHYVELLEIEYLAQQTYLAPHPKELMLRNHV